VRHRRTRRPPTPGSRERRAIPTTATAWLAVRGKLPWRLAAFLSEAHDLQILRQRGGAYQFRHARLQDYLAGVVSPSRAAERVGTLNP
jgi:hypothetical protein